MAAYILGAGVLTLILLSIYGIVKYFGNRAVKAEASKAGQCPHGVSKRRAERACPTCRNKLEMEFNTAEADRIENISCMIPATKNGHEKVYWSICQLRDSERQPLYSCDEAYYIADTICSRTPVTHATPKQ
ncbi:hypothetical protein [uncultured Mediterranean phage]|nr:hypothetical protein [uncultured Mediterranean phage]